MNSQPLFNLNSQLNSQMKPQIMMNSRHDNSSFNPMMTASSTNKNIRNNKCNHNYKCNASCSDNEDDMFGILDPYENTMNFNGGMDLNFCEYQTSYDEYQKTPSHKNSVSFYANQHPGCPNAWETPARYNSILPPTPNPLPQSNNRPSKLNSDLISVSSLR